MTNFTEKEIEKLQSNLSVIRRVAGWTTAELGDLIGVTKQTISNLENKNTKMSKLQYIAIRSVIDYEIADNPENVALGKVVEILLDTEELTEEEQEKVQTTAAYIDGAKSQGISDVALLAGVTALTTALGIAIDSTTKGNTYKYLSEMPKWLVKIIKG